jgi:uncharacterized protein
MSLTKVFIIFIIILAVFFGVVFMQFKGQPFRQIGEQTNSGLATGQVKINSTTFAVEIAKTDEERQLGLSDRKSLDQGKGMLFLFDQPGNYSFWMKNMQFPLDLIFIKDNTVVSVSQNAQPAKGNENPPLFFPEGPINKVLEINAGLAQKYGIKKGSDVEVKQ